MKKSLLLGIIGLAATVASSFGQGTTALDNYSSSITQDEDVLYGNTAAGGTVGTGLNSTFTASLYYVSSSGNEVADFSADASGTALPTSLYSGPGTLTLATGTGSTGGFDNGDTGPSPGEYAPPTPFNPGVGAGNPVTVMIIAYKTSSGSYANATIRGHSAAFEMFASAGPGFTPLTGNAETDGGFSVYGPVPEPSILAFSGIGAAALMLVRRKK